MGDFVTTSENSRETIRDRKTRGNAILTEIRAIFKYIPLGNQRNQKVYYYNKHGSYIVACLTVKYGVDT